MNRRIAFSCTCGVEDVQPGRVAAARPPTRRPARGRRRGRRRRRRTAPVTSSGAGVEQPGVAQRLEGVEEGRSSGAATPACGSSTPALGAGHRPAQHEAVVAGPGRELAGAAARRPRAVAAAPSRSRATAGRSARPCRNPATISRRSSTWKGDEPSTAAPARRSQSTCRSSRLGRRGTGSSPRARSARGSTRAPARSRARRSAPATGPRPARAAVLRLHLRAGTDDRREPVAHGDQPLAPPEPSRRGRGLRADVDLGQRQARAPPGCTTSRPGWRNGGERRDLAERPPTSPPSRGR